MASNNNSSNQMVVPEARAAMDRFKMEAAAELGVLSTTKYTRHLNW
nr:small, acid-soluble spore protein, alpha/beta type [uncultured Butyricicoccus sp.]